MANMDEMPLNVELENYERQGISIWLNGRRSDPYVVEQAMQIREGGVPYMRDFVFGPEGRGLKAVEFTTMGRSDSCGGDNDPAPAKAGDGETDKTDN